jgi:hypothetical protein
MDLVDPGYGETGRRNEQPQRDEYDDRQHV